MLARYPDADLRVYVVWLPMLAGDEQIAVADLAVDERARHYWDGDRVVGRYFAGQAGFGDGVAWDVFLAYGPDGRWGDRPAATGGPVVERGADLRAALAPYLTTR